MNSQGEGLVILTSNISIRHKLKNDDYPYVLKFGLKHLEAILATYNCQSNFIIKVNSITNSYYKSSGNICYRYAFDTEIMFNWNYFMDIVRTIGRTYLRLLEKMQI